MHRGSVCTVHFSSRRRHLKMLKVHVRCSHTRLCPCDSFGNTQYSESVSFPWCLTAVTFYLHHNNPLVRAGILFCKSSRKEEGKKRKSSSHRRRVQALKECITFLLLQLTGVVHVEQQTLDHEQQAASSWSTLPAESTYIHNSADVIEDQCVSPSGTEYKDTGILHYMSGVQRAAWLWGCLGWWLRLLSTKCEAPHHQPATGRNDDDNDDLDAAQINVSLRLQLGESGGGDHNKVITVIED